MEQQPTAVGPLEKADLPMQWPVRALMGNKVHGYFFCVVHTSADILDYSVGRRNWRNDALLFIYFLVASIM